MTPAPIKMAKEIKVKVVGQIVLTASFWLTECRDLLRKLLEPRPELRWPLQEVMVHPWVTVQGTAPLVPYSEQPIDEQMQDKVGTLYIDYMEVIKVVQHL